MPLIISSGQGGVPVAPFTGDPNFSSVVLLAHLDASPTPVDKSNSGHILTVGSSATIQGAQKKFGANALEITALDSNGFISAPNSVDWHFGSGDFTIEMWVRWKNNPTADQTIISQYNSSTNERSWLLIFRSTNELEFTYSTNGIGATSPKFAFNPNAGQWYHLAAVRNGSDLIVFVDGSQIGSTHNIGAASLFNSSAPMKIGVHDNGSSPIDGFEDEVRITTLARYSTSFTPSGPFPNF